MASEDEPDEIEADSNISRVLNLIYLIAEIYTGGNTNRPNQDQQKATERALVKAAQRTACATVFIAVAGVLTFFAAIGQIVYFSRQWTAMEGQLTEMQQQRLLTIQQLSPDFKREYVPAHRILEKPGSDHVVGWDFGTKWTNIGATAAQEFFGRSNIRAFDSIFDKKMLIDRTCPEIKMAHNNGVKGTVVVPQDFISQGQKFLSYDDVSARITGAKFILMWGHIEYKDFFAETPVHNHDWCVEVVPNDISADDFDYRKLSESMN